VLLLALAVLLLRSAWLCDDTYFSLRSAAHLVKGLGLRFNPAERVQAFTNPLWTLSMAAMLAAGVDPYQGILGLSLGCTLGAAWIVAARIAGWPGGALLAVVALASSKAFVDFGACGLENPLLYLLAAAFLALWSAGPRPEERALPLAALAASLGLTRLDALVLVLPHLALLCGRGRSRGAWARLLLGMSPLLGWLGVALVYYGSPVPNSAVVKIGGAELTRLDLIRRGWCYLVDTLPWDRVSLPLVVAAFGLGLLRRDRRWTPTALGIALYLGAAVWVGGDFMLGRFLALPVLCAAILLVGAPVWRRPAVLAGGLALVLGASLSCWASPWRVGASYGAGSDMRPAFRRYDAIDERFWYYRSTGLLARLARYEAPRIPPAREGGPPEVVLAGMAIEAWIAGPACHAVQKHGISDPLLARMPPARAGQIRAGHVERLIPRGYAESLERGGDRLEDPRVRALYDDLLLVTRGPLWTGARWAAIVRLAVGAHAGLRDLELRRDPLWRSHAASQAP
jgi:arabinofuranosyltransferase